LSPAFAAGEPLGGRGWRSDRSAIVLHHATGNPCSTSAEGWFVSVRVATSVNNQCLAQEIRRAEPRCDNTGVCVAVVIHDQLAQVTSVAIAEGAEMLA
jgi:hypothetical protein